MRIAVFTFISISTFVLTHAGPTCMQCNGEADIAVCLTSLITCADNEECYLETVTSAILGKRFNAGCRSKMTCLMTQPLNDNLGNCAACCSDAPDSDGPCNAKLCGQSPAKQQDVCVACDGVHSDFHSCQTTTVCPPTEVCYTGIRVVGFAVRYVFGCYDKHVCRAMARNEVHHSTRDIHGDLGVKMCDACCRGFRCNAADCFQLKKNMTVADFSR
ncbi:uncharacterized protein LOC125662094 [Ostrea edulis]|uniref:uncharacterized protein LOC125662094 n=1 Tax=Ostrea edulis TaxID=37623 RepID=UPI0020965E63|nr:uncharacterized protein LOC125662094 [Ostrea edulis]